MIKINQSEAVCMGEMIEVINVHSFLFFSAFNLLDHLVIVPGIYARNVSPHMGVSHVTSNSLISKQERPRPSL